MSDLYDLDYYAWTVEQGSLLRTGQVSAIDITNVAEEIESMGRAQRNDLTNRLAVLLAHLLKWQFQPERRGRSRELTIREQQRQAARVLRANPSLRPELEAIMSDAYGDAILAAERETALPEDVFPKDCPWTYDQAMQAPA